MPSIRLLVENKNRRADIKNAGQVTLPARRKVAAKPTLSGAEAELAAYELDGDQTDTQQSDRRAPIRHSRRIIRGKTEKHTGGTARIRDRKSPISSGVIKPVTGYGTDAFDVKERCGLGYHS